MRTFFLFISFAFLSIRVQAQPLQEIDNTLAAYFDRITYWDEYDHHDHVDSLDKVNTELYNYLQTVCVSNPATLTANFTKAKKLTVVSSDDSMLRFYSWDSRMGGSMRYYEDMAQYKSATGIRTCNMKDTVTEGDYGSDYRCITTIHTKSNKAVYLVQDFSITSTKDRTESITAYTIDGESLKKVNIFQTKRKLINSIAYGYDVFTSAEKFPKKDIPSIHLSKDKRRLYIPIVSGPYNDVVTNKNLIYIFDGNNYVFDNTSN